ncbi:hypothetical protein BU15DRAFT_78070 [Melanogaster broomeanus]|nr:hypothetical protein BU15DRAFT_78070 [Melanogaster broomeanus]
MGVAGDVTTVATVYGAILLGTCFACILTGIVMVQVVLYFKLYPGDFSGTKFLVFAIWALDLTHTILIIAAVWESVIVGFNQPQNMDVIPSSLGQLQLCSHSWFIVSSRTEFENVGNNFMCGPRANSFVVTKKWYIAAPLVFLAFLRLFAACVSTAEIVILKRYSEFIKPYPSWVFTTGVTLSASVEFIITTTMIIFLRSRKTGFINMNHIINTLVLYTLETGGITCLVTIASLIAWVVMRHNLIFLGMHFAIAKLYANSLLATLNTRKRLRVDRMYSSERENGLTVPLPSPNRSHFSQRILGPAPTPKNMQLNVNVETTVVSKIDERFLDDEEHDDIEAAQTATLTAYEKDEQYQDLRESTEKIPSLA